MADSQTLVSTGPFARLSLDVTLRILLLLPLRDRLACLACCRGWHSLSRLPQLWRRVGLCMTASGANGSAGGAPSWISAGGVARLLSWHVPPAAIQELHLKCDRLMPAGDLVRLLSAQTALRRLHLDASSGKVRAFAALVPLSEPISPLSCRHP